MSKIIFNSGRCKGCGLCVTVCPKKILELSKDSRNPKGYFTAYCTDSSACISCGSCAVICPDCAVEITNEVVA